MDSLNLRQMREFYVGGVFRHGFLNYEIVSVHTPETHPSPSSFGQLLARWTYLMEVIVTSKKETMPMPSCVEGKMCRFRCIG